MGRQRDQQQGDPVVAAIERVLEVERDGGERLRRSRDEAARLLSDARARAAAIGRRADACIAKLHTAYLRKVQSDIQALVGVAPANEGADRAPDRAVLEAAARRVAANLTGGA